MLAAIIQYRYIIIAVLLTFALIGTFKYVMYTEYKRGYATALIHVAEQIREAEEKTRGKQATIRTKSRRVEDEIRKDTGDRPVGPVLRRQLERMQREDD